ncbi:MAG: translocation/assembly module TamB domain-containing protein [Halanaerobiales bacterium]|nr:translocation/assembly module TamB domain-containing protein [Halanaerobiales bacterium]
MKYRHLIIIIILILIIAAGFFYYANIQLDPETILISLIEDTANLEIKYESVSIWPLNKITVNNLEIKGKDFDLKVPQVYLGYSLFDYINNRDQIAKIIRSIELDQPIINYRLKKSDSNQKRIAYHEIEDQIFLLFDQIYFKIDEGKVRINNNNNDFEVNNLNLEISIDNINKNIKFDLKKGFFIKGKLNQFDFENIDTKNLKLTGIYEDKNWQLYLKNQDFELEGYYNLFNKSEFKDLLADFKVDQLTGTASLKLNIKGTQEKIDSYNAYIDLKNINTSLIKSNSNIKQSILIEDAHLELNNENIVLISSANININDSLFSVDGYYNLNNNNYKAQISSNNFYLNNELVNSYFEEKIDQEFDTQGELKFNLSGNSSEQDLIISANFNQLNIKNHSFYDLSIKARYLNSRIYIDKLNFNTEQSGTIDLSGFYSLKGSNYSLKLAAEEIYLDHYQDIKIVRDYINQSRLNNFVNGKLSFNLDASGPLDSLKKGIYKFELVFRPGEDNLLSDYKISQIKSNFLYFEDELYINQGKVKINGNFLNIEGRYDLKDDNLDFKSYASNLDLSILKDYDQKIEIGGNISYNSIIKGSLSQPVIKGEVKDGQIYYQENNFEKINFDFSYKNKNLSIKSLTISSNQANLTGQGSILIDTGFDNITQSSVSFKLETNKINYKQIKTVSNLDFPLYGFLSATINIKGKLVEPILDIRLVSNDTEIKIMENRYSLNRSELNIRWIYGDNQISLDDSLVIRDDFHLLMSGTYLDQVFDLNFKINNFDISEFQIAKNLNGLFEMEGNIKGSFTDPELELNFISEDFSLNDFKSKKLTGHLTYQDDKIDIKELKLLKNSYSYNMIGTVDNVSKDRKLDLLINTNQGDLETLFALGGIELPFRLDYTFNGNVKVNGNLGKPITEISLSVIQDSKRIIDINGVVGDTIDLTFSGESISLASLKFPDSYKPGFSYNGTLNVSGTVKGQRDDYRLIVHTDIENLEINDILLQSMKGEIIYNNGQFELEQRIVQNQDEFLSITGNLNTQKMANLNLNLSFNNYSLNNFDRLSESLLNIEGSLDGSLNFSGNIDQPEIVGEVDFNLTELLIKDIQPINNFNTKLKFANKRVQLKKSQGEYGDGKFLIEGTINYLDNENFWNLSLTGENLLIEKGDYNGQFDLTVVVKNRLREPLIKGKIEAHDFSVSPPHRWPTSEGGTEPLIQPKLDLLLIPKENVNYRNQNIDITVGGGDLKLVYNKEEGISIDGRLTSNQGTIDYYNNKFILNNGTAVFTRFGDNIPEISANASTIVSGTRIFIFVDGPGDNMNISFSSQPELTENEILALLTKRGGLSGFTGEQDSDPGRLIQSEFMRIIGENIQLDLISSIEKKLREIFSLDRFEIDTYDLGWNRELTVYMGKRIKGDLYLEYTATFSPERRDDEFTFKYDLNKYINLEGGWYGEDDYRFSIEATINF